MSRESQRGRTLRGGRDYRPYAVQHIDTVFEACFAALLPSAHAAQDGPFAKTDGQWAHWCYLPTWAASAVLIEQYPELEPGWEQVFYSCGPRLMAALVGFDAMPQCLFPDATIVDACLTQPPSEVLAFEAFTAMPKTAVYISTPGALWMSDWPLDGTFAFIDDLSTAESADARPALVLIPVVDWKAAPRRLRPAIHVASKLTLNLDAIQAPKLDPLALLTFSLPLTTHAERSAVRSERGAVCSFLDEGEIPLDLKDPFDFGYALNRGAHQLANLVSQIFTRRSQVGCVADCVPSTGLPRSR